MEPSDDIGIHVQREAMAMANYDRGCVSCDRLKSRIRALEACVRELRKACTGDGIGMGFVIVRSLELVPEKGDANG